MYFPKIQVLQVGRMVEAGEDLTAADAEIEDGDVVSLPVFFIMGIYINLRKKSKKITMGRYISKDR